MSSASSGVASGYCYLNVSVMRSFGERSPGLSWRTIDEQFFGAQPGLPDCVEQSGDVRRSTKSRTSASCSGPSWTICSALYPPS
jgi:hypothetical protein